MTPSFTMKRSTGAVVGQISILVAALVVAAAAGAGIGLFGNVFGLLVAGAMLGLLFLALPLNYLMWIMLIMVFLVVGQVIYFARIDRIIWAPYLLGALLFVRIPLEILKSQENLTGTARRKITAFGAAVLLFLFVAALSTIVNQAPLIQGFVSLKEYLFLWSIFLVLSLGLASESFKTRVWFFFLWLAPLQVPMVLYQRFVVAPSRAGPSAWDAIVGLFGGNPDGGGASGAMAFFLIFTVILALSMWRDKLIRTPFLLLVVGSSILCIALAEVKAAILVLPLAIFLLYRKDALRRPLTAIAMGLFAIATAFVILLSYQTQFASDRTSAGRSIQGYVEQMFERSVDTDYFAYRNTRLNRTTALKYWYTENGLDEPFQLLLGHGIGATKVGNLSVGSAAQKHIYRLDASSATIFLWETGVIGFGLVVVFFLLAANMARTAEAATGQLTPLERAVAAATAPMLLLLMLELAYNTDFANVLPAQLLTVLLFGYSSMLHRKIQAAKRARP
jgi:hypothetical protein